jgi:peptidoglycan/xylan/chitin deacetylase (PgdA/CDA1 family)
MHQDAEWTEKLMRLAFDRHVEVFGCGPATHGAAGWQMNGHAFRLHDEMGLRFASDTRGTHPFKPALGDGISHCVQLPTTLPTLDELIGRADLADRTPVAHLLSLTEAGDRDHVYTLHAELEGRKLMPWFEQLLKGWQAQGYRLTSMGEYHGSLDRATIPVGAVVYREIPGRSGVLAVQQG